MTPTEYAIALRDLKWTSSFVARQCGYTRQAAARWLDGSARIPAPVEDWLNTRLEGYLTEPPERLSYA